MYLFIYVTIFATLCNVTRVQKKIFVPKLRLIFWEYQHAGYSISIKENLKNRYFFTCVSGKTGCSCTENMFEEY